jgi:arylsulfatase A-like enzyme
VPLVIRGPGIPENQTRGQLVNNLDVVATIVELARASPGATLDGHSLGPLFADSNAPWRSAIAFESPSAHFLGPAERYTGVRTATRKYIKFDTGVEMLYDLAADPHESNSKTGNAAYAGDLALLRGLNEKLKSCTGETCWVP